VRGSVVLVEGGKSLTLVSVAGNLSPIDLLHLRGHFRDSEVRWERAA